MSNFQLRLDSANLLGSVAELVDAPDLKSVERFSSWGFKSPHSHYLIICLVLTITSKNCYVLTKEL